MRKFQWRDGIKLIKKFSFRNSTIVFYLILLWIVFFVTNQNFRQIDNYLNILREASFIGVAAIGMTFCIIIGGIDLSIGAMLSILSLITVSIVGKVGLVPMVIIILLLGAICGSINGLLYAKVRLPAFISTLAMGYIYNSLALIYSNGKPIQFSQQWFTVIGNGNVVGIPIPFIIFIILAFVGNVIIKNTYIGRQMLSIGNSEKVSYLSGINIYKVKVIVFALVGMFTGAAAILISSRLWSANAQMKLGYEFDVIAAVVLGGTPLKGGKGSIFNTVVASVIFASIFTGMNMFHINSYIQKVVEGIILLCAFAISSGGKLVKKDYLKIEQ